MINYSVSPLEMLRNDKLAFLPYRGPFKYGDGHFISSYLRHLIPSGKQLTDFINDDEESDQKNMLLYIRAAKMIFTMGYPEHAPMYIKLFPGIPEQAHAHLVWMSSDATIELITEGMDLDREEKEAWWLTVYSYLLSQWIGTTQVYKLVYFNEALFSPTKLLVCEETDDSWAFIKAPDIFNKCETFGFNSFKDCYPKAKKIIERFHFYGGNEAFYQALQFHDFLPPISTYSLVTSRMQDRTKDGINVAAVLMSFYMSEETLDKCAKALN